MKKKNLVLLLLACLVLLALGSSYLFQKQGNKDLKTIGITIIDQHEGTVLYDGTLQSNHATLGDLLSETDEIAVGIEKGSYGAYIVSMMDHESDQEYFWVYESENNASCEAMGMCPAIDDCLLEDGDTFTFELTNTFE